MERIKQFHRVLFDYKINVFLYNKNMVYAVTLSESQRVKRWWLILEEFGPNIQNKSGVDNIVADTLSRLPYISIDKYEPRTRKSQCCVNELFDTGRVENNEDCFWVTRDGVKPVNKK